MVCRSLILRFRAGYRFRRGVATNCVLSPILSLYLSLKPRNISALATYVIIIALAVMVLTMLVVFVIWKPQRIVILRLKGPICGQKRQRSEDSKIIMAWSVSSTIYTSPKIHLLAWWLEFLSQYFYASV